MINNFMNPFFLPHTSVMSKRKGTEIQRWIEKKTRRKSKHVSNRTEEAIILPKKGVHQPYRYEYEYEFIHLSMIYLGFLTADHHTIEWQAQAPHNH